MRSARFVVLFSLLATQAVARDSFLACRSRAAAVRWWQGSSKGRAGLRQSGQCFRLDGRWRVIDSDETQALSVIQLVPVKGGQPIRVWSHQRLGDD